MTRSYPWNCLQSYKRWPGFEPLDQYTPLRDITALDLVCQNMHFRYPDETNFRALEIGSFVGTTAMVFSDHGFTVNCVDTWEGSPDEDPQNPTNRQYQADSDNVFRTFLKNTSGRPIYGHRGRSDQLAHLFPDNHYHIIFIDGDHTYAAVKRDIELYLPKVMPGGVLLGHDYGPAPDVERAVKDAFGHLGFPGIAIVGECIWSHEKKEVLDVALA